MVMLAMLFIVEQRVAHQPSLSRMNRNQTGCSIFIRCHDSRGCYGKRADRAV